jgi:hypothetical protein
MATCNFIQCRVLMAQRARKGSGIEVHANPTKVLPVRVRHLRTYRHTQVCRPFTHGMHRNVITSVTTTCNVRASNQTHEQRLMTIHPRLGGFPEVAVHVHSPSHTKHPACEWLGLLNLPSRAQY